MLSTAMSVDLNIWVVGLLILSLFPSNEYDNAYGLSNCIEKVGSNFIRIDFTLCKCLCNIFITNKMVMAIYRVFKMII